jgi:hypothetical protein
MGIKKLGAKFIEASLVKQEWPGIRYIREGDEVDKKLYMVFNAISWPALISLFLLVFTSLNPEKNTAIANATLFFLLSGVSINLAREIRLKDKKGIIKAIGVILFTLYVYMNLVGTWD